MNRPQVPWTLVEQLFARALDLGPSDRKTLLEAVAGSDAALAREVRSLLDALDLDPPRLDASSAEALLRQSPDPAMSEVQTLGRYRVLRVAGRGGMGVVYLARDPVLERFTALKVLSPHLRPDGEARKRFLREARAASALDHPHVATIYEVGDTPDGRLFIAMAWCEGPTIREKLISGPIPMPDALRIGMEAASGLAAAHARGIVHRDVKPENLMDTPEGGVRVVDFGVARVLGSGNTAAGARIGTVAYMSPEQTRGEPADARSDVWALGVVLHEMLLGSHPFRKDSDALTLDSIRNHRTLSVKGLPSSIARILHRSLSGDPQRRYPSAIEMREALEKVLRDVAPDHVPARTRVKAWTARSSTRRPVTLAALLILLILAVGTLWLSPLTRASAPPGPGSESLLAGAAFSEGEAVVLSDMVATGPAGPLARVVTEALRIDLLRSPSFTLLDASRAGEVLARMGQDPADGLPADMAREVAIREGLKAFISGEISPLGGGFILTARVHAASDGSLLAGVRESADNEAGLIDALDRLSKALREEIGEPLRSIRESPPLPAVATSSLPALTRFAEANALAWAGGDQIRMIELLEEAIALDSLFADAHRSLAAVYWNTRAERRRTVEATERAYQLRDRLAPADAELLEALRHWQLRGDAERTAEAYRRVLARDPDNIAALNNLGLALLFLDEAAEAETVLRTGIDVADLPLLHVNLAEALHMQGRTAEGLLHREEMIQGSEASPILELARVRLLGATGQWDQAEAISRRILQAHPTNTDVRIHVLRGLWHLALLRGKLEEADGWYASLVPLLEDAGSLDALARIKVQKAEVALWLLGDQASAAATLRELAVTPDDELAQASATLAPRVAATLAAIGDLARARSLLAAWEALPLEERADPAGFSPALAQARILRAQGEPEAAASLLLAAERSDLQSIDFLPELASAWAEAGQPDSARVTIRRYLDHPHPRRLHRIPAHLGPLLLQLGSIEEMAGDRAAAQDAYAEALELWEHADPAFAHEVQFAREGIERLDAAPQAAALGDPGPSRR